MSKANTPPFPLVPPALLVALQELFPAKDPKKGQTLDELMFHGGERKVITFLEIKAREQTNNILS